jgi:hypothetical protein
MPYKISGTNSDASTVYVLQDKEYLGYKDIDAGNYTVTFDSTTPSGITAVAEKDDGHVVGYGNVIAITTSGSTDITPPVPSGAIIKSIQHFYEAFTGAETQIDVTIDEVDTTKTIIVFTDGKCHAAARNDNISIRLINSTTVRLCKFLAAGTPNVAFSVVEYLSGVNLIQRGYTILSGLDDIEDITIVEVDLSKSFALHLGFVSSTSTAGISGWVRLLNSTTLRCESDYGDPTISWEVIEFS